MKKSEQEIIAEFKKLKNKTLLRVFKLLSVFLLLGLIWGILTELSLFHWLEIEPLFGFFIMCMPLVIYANYIDFKVQCPNCGGNPSDNADGNPIFSKQCGECGVNLS